MSHIRLPGSELRTVIKFRNHWFIFIGCIPSFLHFHLEVSGHVVGERFMVCKSQPYDLGSEEVHALIQAHNEGRLQEVRRLRHLDENEFIIGNANVLLIMSISQLRKEMGDLYEIQEKNFGPPTDPIVVKARKDQAEAQRALLEAKKADRAAQYALERTSYDCTFSFVPKSLENFFGEDDLPVGKE